MITRNAIGIDASRASELVFSLNTLLSNYAVFYQNVRGYHWNIRGGHFFELHAKFEELFMNLQNTIDQIAERILTLGGVPLHTFVGFTEHATIHAVANVTDGRSAVMNVIDSLNVIIEIQRSIDALSTETGDEGTCDLMSDNIRAQEKLVWMYSAYLG